MILLYLKGGIGNQMFEYAAGKALSLHLNTILKFDKSYYDQNHYHREGSLNNFYNIPYFRDILKNFKITAHDATVEEIHRFQQNYLNKILHRLKPNHLRRKYIQPHAGFDPNFFRIQDNTLLKGYFQSEKYFFPYSNEIRKELSFNEDIPLRNTAMAEKISSCTSVAVHLRRGDYVHHPVSSNILGALDNSFYQSAKEFIEKELNGPLTYFVFSDDPEWVKTNLTIFESVYFITKDTASSDIDELYLMTQCKHNIIANSSFSWWGAWLNNNPDKIVIAPKKWYNKGPKDSQDLVPGEWLRI